MQPLCGLMLSGLKELLLPFEGWRQLLLRPDKGKEWQVKPYVSQIVLYTPFDHLPEAYAAIVTGVTNIPNPDLRVSLCCFTKRGFIIEGSVPFSATQRPGYWSLPIKGDA